ncbi:Chromo domain-containing protein, partial [Cephalotus follicularis]
VFHVSQLKKFKGTLPATHPRPLPPLLQDNQPVLTPVAIISTRRIHKVQGWQFQVLVQRFGMAPEEATWEDIAVIKKLYPTLHLEKLEDKVNFDGDGNDMVTLDESIAANSGANR